MYTEHRIIKEPTIQCSCGFTVTNDYLGALIMKAHMEDHEKAGE